MGQRVRGLIVGCAVVGAIGFFAWYLRIHRPTADVITEQPAACTNGSAQCFETPEQLRGSGDNQAELKDVTIDERGLHLATVAPAAAASGSTTPLSATEPSALTTLSPTAELKYRLEAEFGKARPCGGPVERIVQESEKLAAFPAIAADPALLSSLLAHTNIANAGSWTDAEKLTVVNESTRLASIGLTALVDPPDSYTFSTTTDQKRLAGTIQTNGPITKTSEGGKNCPICLAGTTRIDTPAGTILVSDLTVGMPIWTVDAQGQRLAGTVLQTGRTPVINHHVVQLVLADGRTVTVSPGHPTADGRLVGELTAGDRYDGSLVTSAALRPYDQPATYDVLPSGPTGFYWADGVQLGSTLGPKAPRN